MISYKGRIGFIQYMPKKPKKWGLKAFALSDSQHWEHGQWHDSCSGYETCWFTEEQGPPRLHRQFLYFTSAICWSAIQRFWSMRHFENEQARYSTSHKANHQEGNDKSGERRWLYVGNQVVGQTWSYCVNRTEQRLSTPISWVFWACIEWTLFSPYSWSWSHPQISLGVVYMLPKVVEELLEKRSDFE